MNTKIPSLTPLIILGFSFALQFCFPLSGAESQSTGARLFDHQWAFALGDVPNGENPDLDDSAWRRLDLPHDWSIEGDYDQTAATGGSGGFLPTGIGWYRKTFPTDASMMGKQVTIRFGGVYQCSTVWINGHELGFRPYGYSEFYYDLTPWLHRATDERPNVIAVRVDNSRQPNSRWYSGSGIYRSVWLTVTDPLHIPEWGTQVNTVQTDISEAELQITVAVKNNRTSDANAILVNELINPQGHAVQRMETPFQVQSGELNDVKTTIIIEDPLHWSPTNPQLYRLRSRIEIDAVVVDEYVTRFGIRTLNYDTDHGLLLNGESVKLRGMCLHHDAGAVGAAVPKAVLQRRLQLLQQMGCNAIRCSHNPMASEFYDLCDEMGLLVMDEAFDEWTVRKPQIQFGYSDFFEDWHEKDLVDLIHRNRNHPSIVMWSAGNEIGEQWAEQGPEILGKLVSIFHREDPTRPVTAAMDNIFNQDGQAPTAFSSQLDIVGYNYVDRWGMRRETHYADDRCAFPERKFVGTENRSVRGVRGVYTFGALQGGGFAGGKIQPGIGPEGALYLNDSIEAAELWRFVATHDYVIGDFAWTGFDYLGESWWPGKLAASGPLDTCGFKKDAYYFYQSIWTEKPMIHLFPHWNWPERIGKVVPVVVYSNCEVVELFVNGKSFGAKAREFPRQGAEGGWNTYARPIVRSSTVDMQLVWDVPYEEGKVVAVGYKNGEAVVRSCIQTAGEAEKLELIADKSSLHSNRPDVIHLSIRALDADGIPVPFANHLLKVTVQGAARLIGLDNGDPTSHASYKGTERHLFNGMALAILQSDGTTGAITVKVEAEGLEDATLTFQASGATD